MEISLDAGTHMNEAKVVFTGDTAQFRLAAGITLHDTVQQLVGHAEKGFVGYAENLYSQTPHPVYCGRGYTGLIFLNRLSDVKQQAGHILGISHYKAGEVYRYFFGAGWNRYDFKTDQDWFNYLAQQRMALLNPLKVTVRH
jgi:hypothetical protein